MGNTFETQRAASQERLKEGMAVLFLAALCLLFFWPIITPDPADRRSFPPGDFGEQFHAFALFESRELYQGRFPLWSPYTYSGHPFQADIQAAVFYPPSLATIALSWLFGGGDLSFLALEWEVVAHFFLASLFAYLFAHRLMRHRGAALVTAVTFTFGGYLTSYPGQQLAVLEVGVWLPLILLLVDTGLEQVGTEAGAPSRFLQRSGYIAGAGLSWGVSLLAGHPQTSLYVFYTAMLYFLFSAWRYRVRWTWTAAALILFHILGFGLAAVHLVPGLEYMRLSTRAEISFAEAAGGFARQDLLQIILPGSVSVMSPLYVGILPLLLALLAPIILRRTTQVIFWSALALIALLVSFGGHTFVYSLFYLFVPGFGMYRSQERAAYIFSFALAVLAGYGALLLLRPLGRRTRRLFNGFCRAVGYLAAGSFLLVALNHYGWLTDEWSVDSPFGPALTRSVLLSVFLLLAAAAFYLRRGRRVRSGTWTALALLLIVFDLFTVNWRNNLSDVPPEAHWQATPLVLVPMQDDGVFRVYNEHRLPGNYGCVYNLEDIWGASPLRLDRYDELFNAVPEERLWRLLNVKYVITWRKVLATSSEVLYEEPHNGEMAYLHELEEVGPRAYVVYEVERADGDTALKRLTDPAFDPLRTALLEEPLPFELPRNSPAEPAHITFLREGPGHVSLDVDLPADGLLVLSEVYYPGWHATIDGSSAAILRVQHALRGLPLRAGRHHIEMHFLPMTFVAGAALSGLTLVTGLAWIILARRRGRTDKSDTLDSDLNVKSDNNVTRASSPFEIDRAIGSQRHSR